MKVKQREEERARNFFRRSESGGSWTSGEKTSAPERKRRETQSVSMGGALKLVRAPEGVLIEILESLI